MGLNSVNLRSTRQVKDDSGWIWILSRSHCHHLRSCPLQVGKVFGACLLCEYFQQSAYFEKRFSDMEYYFAVFQDK